MRTLDLARLINQRVSDHMAGAFIASKGDISERFVDKTMEEAVHVAAALIDKYRPATGPIGGKDAQDARALSKTITGVAGLMLITGKMGGREGSDVMEEIVDTVMDMVQNYTKNVRIQVLAEVEASAKAGGDLMAAVMEARK